VQYIKNLNTLISLSKKVIDDTKKEIVNLELQIDKLKEAQTHILQSIKEQNDKFQDSYLEELNNYKKASLNKIKECEQKINSLQNELLKLKDKLLEEFISKKQFEELLKQYTLKQKAIIAKKENNNYEEINFIKYIKSLNNE
jgi:hypothetical protein